MARLDAWIAALSDSGLVWSATSLVVVTICVMLPATLAKLMRISYLRANGHRRPLWVNGCDTTHVVSRESGQAGAPEVGCPT